MRQSHFNYRMNENPDFFFMQNKIINESHLAEEGYLKNPEEQRRRLFELANKIVREAKQGNNISGE